jgi:hypothetical protein
MASGARRLIGSGVAYLLFGAFMLYMGLCALGIIQSKDIPKGNFFAITSVAIGIFDLIIGARRLFSWGAACPYCGYPKVNLFGDVTWVYCRACKRKIVRKGAFVYREE